MFEEEQNDKISNSIWWVLNMYDYIEILFECNFEFYGSTCDGHFSYINDHLPLFGHTLRESQDTKNENRSLPTVLRW